LIQSETSFCPSRLIKGHNRGANYIHILVPEENTSKGKKIY